jgi:hypothetical protein
MHFWCMTFSTFGGCNTTVRWGQKRRQRLRAIAKDLELIPRVVSRAWCMVTMDGREVDRMDMGQRRIMEVGAAAWQAGVSPGLWGPQHQRFCPWGASKTTPQHPLPASFWWSYFHYVGLDTIFTALEEAASLNKPQYFPSQELGVPNSLKLVWYFLPKSVPTAGVGRIHNIMGGECNWLFSWKEGNLIFFKVYLSDWQWILAWLWGNVTIRCLLGEHKLVQLSWRTTWKWYEIYSVRAGFG